MPPGSARPVLVQVGLLVFTGTALVPNLVDHAEGRKDSTRATTGDGYQPEPLCHLLPFFRRCAQVHSAENVSGYAHYLLSIVCYHQHILDPVFVS